MLNDGTGGMQARMHQLANELENIIEILVLNSNYGDFFNNLYKISGNSKEDLKPNNTIKRENLNYKLTIFDQASQLSYLRDIHKVLHNCNNNHIKILCAGNSTTAYTLLVRLISRLDVTIGFLFRNSLTEKALWKRSMYKLTYKFLLRKGDAIISISQGLQEEIKVLSKYVTRSVIYNGVEELKIDGRYQSAGTLCCRMLVIARLELQKRIDVALNAVCRLKKQGYSIELDIYGDGSQRDFLKQQILQNQICKEVKMHGWVNRVDIDYSRYDLFVLSSDFEGFGISVIEALSMGVPAIVTDCPHGPSEIIQDGQCGFIVSRGSGEQIASAVQKWVKLSNDEKSVMRDSAIMRSKQFSEKEMLYKYKKSLT